MVMFLSSEILSRQTSLAADDALYVYFLHDRPAVIMSAVYSGDGPTL